MHVNQQILIMIEELHLKRSSDDGLLGSVSTLHWVRLSDLRQLHSNSQLRPSSFRFHPWDGQKVDTLRDKVPNPQSPVTLTPPLSLPLSLLPHFYWHLTRRHASSTLDEIPAVSFSHEQIHLIRDNRGHHEGVLIGPILIPARNTSAFSFYCQGIHI